MIDRKNMIDKSINNIKIEIERDNFGELKYVTIIQ